LKNKSPSTAGDSSMRAIIFERNGGPEVLEPKDLPDPAPGEG
jgi:hypothetical protein